LRPAIFLNDAVLRLLNEKRRLETERVDLVGQLAGIIASIESGLAQTRETRWVPMSKARLRRDDPEGAEVPTALELAADPRADPEQVVARDEELTQEQLFHQLKNFFARTRRESHL